MVEEKENNFLSWRVYLLVVLAIIGVFYLLLMRNEGIPELGRGFPIAKPQYHISNAFGIVN
jgi:hypothetical protein